MRAWYCTVALLWLTTLAGCGGGAEPTPQPQRPAATAAPLPPPPSEGPIYIFPGRGEPKSSTLVAQISASEIAQALAAGSKLQGVVPRYGVSCYRLTYLTIDGQGRQVLASGLAVVPDKSAGRESPVISYQHGTIFRDAEAPSNALGPGEPPMVMASLGYIVLAADYVGYGVSKSSQHPYLLAEPTAAAVVDLITAARLLRQWSGLVRGNGQLFLVGYSEGGYATMAAHRALQAGNSPHLDTLVASAPGAGPYDVGTTLDSALDRVRNDYPVLGALIKPGFLRHLGSTVRDEVRRALMRQIIPDDADVSFQTTFLDNFLADDVGAIDRMSNVHDWKPETPVRMYQGRDDAVVPYRVATGTLAAMLARGANPALVSLTECPAEPADHLKCVPPYFARLMAYLADLARDL